LQHALNPSAAVLVAGLAPNILDNLSALTYECQTSPAVGTTVVRKSFTAKQIPPERRARPVLGGATLPTSNNCQRFPNRDSKIP
jgi:hypothetical protein